MNTQLFDKKIASAKAYLRIVSPFFACLCDYCPVYSDEKIETACVNELGVIRINPGFAESLSVTQTAVLLCHEAMHPAWGVFWRSRDLNHDPLLSNIAHDHVVNLILSSSHPDWSIPGWLCDQKYSKMCYEEVYVAISRQKRHNEAHHPCGRIGQDVRPSGSCMPSHRHNEDMWTNRVVGAFQMASSVGNVPDMIQRAVTMLLEPSVSWQDFLFSRVSDSISKTKCDWSCPGRRSDSLGIHCPTENHLGADVAVAVDTSGSIGDDSLARAATEILELSSDAGAECRLLVCDAEIASDVRLKDFDPLIFRGGGGTDFSPVFRHLEQSPPRMLIYFTDGFGTFPEEEPPFPVIWAIYEEKGRATSTKVPFGEILKIPN